MKKTVYSCLLTIVLTGCVTTPPPPYKNVQVHNQVSSLLDSCKKLGPVEANTLMVWGNEYDDDQAKNELREKVFKMHGDSVVILNWDRGGMRVKAQGLALNCFNTTKQAGNPK